MNFVYLEDLMNIALILNYNNYVQTIKCCRNILLIDCVCNIVIVDNGSRNDSLHLLKKEFLNSKRVSVIGTKTNLGYARGNNFGLKYIERKCGISNKNVIFIVNPDSLVTYDNICSIVRIVKSKIKCGMVTNLINNTNKSAWYHINKCRAFLFNFWFIRLLLSKINVYDNKLYDVYGNQKIQSVDVVTGAFFGIRQDVFKLVNYFDEATFLYYEEEALSAKLRINGYQSYLDTRLSFKHIGSTSTKFPLYTIKKINDTSKMYVLKKYYKASNLYLFTFKCVQNLDNFILKYLFKKGRTK